MAELADAADLKSAVLTDVRVRVPPQACIAISHDPTTAPMGELRIRLQPRAKKSEIVGEREGALVVRVNASPVDGKANAALCKLLAKRLGVPAGAVAVVRGHTSRDKLVAVDGIETHELRLCLTDAP